MLRNPVFNADVRFGTSGGGTGVDLSVVQDFLDVFAIPLRRRGRGVRVRGGKAARGRRGPGPGGETRRAFYSVQAAQAARSKYARPPPSPPTRRTTSAATPCRREHQRPRLVQRAGGVGAIALDLAGAEAEVAQARRAAGRVLIGVWGPRTQWTLARHCPTRRRRTPACPRRGWSGVPWKRALSMAAARQGVEGEAARLGLARPLGVFEGAWMGTAARARLREAGPWGRLSLPIPLFNQGQPATSAAASELRTAPPALRGPRGRCPLRARAAWSRLDAARSRAAYYQQVILPLRHIVEQTQRQFNAMQVSPFQLLSARQQQVEAGGRSMSTRCYEYWTADGLRPYLERKAPGPRRGKRSAARDAGGCRQTGADTTDGLKNPGRHCACPGVSKRFSTSRCRR